MEDPKPWPKLVEVLNAQCVEQLRRKYVLPANFKENFLRCLPAGIESLKACLCLLSKVTFRGDHHDPLELLALWRRVRAEYGPLSFIEANFLKAAAKVTELGGVPEVFLSSVEFEVLFAVLISSINQNRALETEFVTKLDSVKRQLSELETVDLAEKLLDRKYIGWPPLISVFPELFAVMLVLSYGDPSFSATLRSLSDQDKNFESILVKCQTSWFKLD